MAGKGEIRTGTLVNWEGVSEDLGALAFRGLHPDYLEKKHIGEFEKRFRDLEADDISNEIFELDYNHAYCGHAHPECINEILKYPFIEKKEIVQLHDSVEELIGKPELFSSIKEGFSQWISIEKELRDLLMTSRINFLTYEKARLENYSVLSAALEEADSRLLKDFRDVFDSWNWGESPAGEYYNIVNSPNIKARVDINGFELFSENKDIKVDYSNAKSFTKGDGLAQACLEGSIQRQKANKILKGSANLLYFLKAVSFWNKKLNFVKPCMNESGEVDIRQGYHPLLVSGRRRGRQVVKNDTKIGGGVRILAVTGPNLAGKTTYIKGLALTSLLAQAGSFVPADYANVPIYQRFLTHFGSEDNLMNDLSLFQAEINDLNRNLHRLDDKTLLVCDELFRGTESGELGGARLHKGLVESLVYDFKGRTLLSSHYHESLAAQKHIPEIHFSRLAMNGDSDPDYIVREGIDEGGYAVKAAIKAGLSNKVCERLK